MRYLLIAVAATLVMLPAAVPANACGAAKASAQAAAADYSAKKKKPLKMAARKPKEKVEYMRAAPMK